MTIEEKEYLAPTVKTVDICTRGIMCQSGNQSMREVDFGDGGFTES